jgi:hypothetical protein
MGGGFLPVFAECTSFEPSSCCFNPLPSPSPPLTCFMGGWWEGEGVRLCRGKTAKLEPIKVTGKKFGKMAAWIMDVPAPISTKLGGGLPLTSHGNIV